LKPFSSLSEKLPCVLTIAGSDSSGGAGIQADLRTFGALGVHGLSAITAITAQNSRRVWSIRCVSAPRVRDQIDAAFEEFDIAAVKIGMLGSAATIRSVAAVLERRAQRNIVLDPVLVSSSGTQLLPRTAVAILIDRLIPLADVLTPNRPEAAALLGRNLPAEKAARELLKFGAASVLLKGGHSRGHKLVDHFVGSSGSHNYLHERLPIRARGTGCVLSSAIAANLALGMAPSAAVSGAERFLQNALRQSRLASDSETRLILPTVSTKK
jgi:hydroxymethylpyrimidine/phosphomethylpyrimidine kinase